MKKHYYLEITVVADCDSHVSHLHIPVGAKSPDDLRAYSRADLIKVLTRIGFANVSAEHILDTLDQTGPDKHDFTTTTPSEHTH